MGRTGIYACGESVSHHDASVSEVLFSLKQEAPASIGGSTFTDYHVNITGDGKIYVSTDNLADVLAHTYYRNSGSIGISLCCCAGATTSDLGDEPPTPQQIEAIAQAACAVADGLWLTIDREHVMTHGEAADNADGLDINYPGGPYGPQNTCERWDLQYLGTDESREYTTDYDDPATGGNVLRGKANWYRQHNND